jgi:hypothetical protein
VPTLTAVVLLGEDGWAVVCAELVRAARAMLLDDPEPEDEPDDEPKPKPDDEPEPDDERDDEPEPDDEPARCTSGRTTDGRPDPAGPGSAAPSHRPSRTLVIVHRDHWNRWRSSRAP